MKGDPQKRCPHCSGKPVVEEHRRLWYVRCTGCGALTHGSTKALAVAAWERRIDLEIDANVNKVIDLLTESRDVLGLVVGEQKDEIARLKAEIERLKSGGSE